MDTLVVENSEAEGPDKALFTNSSLREKILEHQFVGELLRVLWCKGMQQVPAQASTMLGGERDRPSVTSTRQDRDRASARSQLRAFLGRVTDEPWPYAA